MGNRGLLIAFEGIDGSGKTTQAMRLVGNVMSSGNELVIYTKEPTDGPEGQRLRESARTGRLPPEEELALFIADRRRHVDEVILPALENGITVVVDRYYPSNVAYQGARGLDPLTILAQNEAFAPAPDLCVWLDVEPEVSIARISGRGGQDAFEYLEDLNRCREIYREIDRPWWRKVRSGRWPDQVSSTIYDMYLDLLESRCRAS
jgi:dTMP kinase